MTSTLSSPLSSTCFSRAGFALEAAFGAGAGCVFGGVVVREAVGCEAFALAAGSDRGILVKPYEERRFEVVFFFSVRMGGIFLTV